MADYDEAQEAVRRHYAAAAKRVATDRAVQCCASKAGIGAGCYEAAELAELPGTAVNASLGCANPVTVAELAEGETVLDLGSGGGIDVLLSARRVGPAGKAYGLDMTDEMLELARVNQAQAGVNNVEFLKGHMEAIPLPDASVDVVLSNCVIALSVDKSAVFAEAYRVLRPGGRLAVADVLADAGRLPAASSDIASWVDCVAGALTATEYRNALDNAGFVEVSIAESHSVAPGSTSAVVRAVRPMR